MFSTFRWIYRLARVCLPLVGLATLCLGAMLAWPLQAPPELKSIVAGARAVDYSDLPDLETFQARDGTYLAYRVYEPPAPASDRVAILLHGSSGSSINIHAAARALAAVGVRALAPDIRGHGRSGGRGDIAYMGQLDDDLADFVAHARLTWPSAPLILAGHSAGGALALRTALGANAGLFERYVLLAPYLAPETPTGAASGPGTQWAAPDIPRIAAITILRRLGIACCDGLPVLAFGLPRGSEPFATPLYSYRLMANFVFDPLAPSIPGDARKPIEVIAGDADELMDATRYESVLRGAAARVTILPGVNHMGLVAAPEALAAIVAAVTR